MRTKTIICVLVVSLFLLLPEANAFRFSVGGFGGLNYPVAQKDAKKGSLYGLKARIPFLSFLAVEPNFTHLKNGDGEVQVGEPWNTTMTHEGGKYSSFGADLAFGGVSGYSGFHAFGIVGIASSKFEKKGIPDLTKSSYWFGLGLEFSFADKVSLEVRGKTLVFPYSESVTAASGGVQPSGTGSRKNGVITFGINIYLGSEGGK